MNKPLFGSLQKISFFLLNIFFLFFLHPAILAFAQNSNISVTVYNQNFALVRQTFSFQLEKGEQNIRIEDVAKSIDPTSVHLRSLSDPKSLIILEQVFEYDLIESNKVLSKFIDQTIQLIDSKGNLIEGKLLSVGSDLLLANENEEITLIKNKKASMGRPRYASPNTKRRLKITIQTVARDRVTPETAQIMLIEDFPQ